jgi:hypothetical protein
MLSAHRKLKPAWSEQEEVTIQGVHQLAGERSDQRGRVRLMGECSQHQHIGVLLGGKRRQRGSRVSCERPNSIVVEVQFPSQVA